MIAVQSRTERACEVLEVRVFRRSQNEATGTKPTSPISSQARSRSVYGIHLKVVQLNTKPCATTTRRPQFAAMRLWGTEVPPGFESRHQDAMQSCCGFRPKTSSNTLAVSGSISSRCFSDSVRSYFQLVLICRQCQYSNFDVVSKSLRNPRTAP